MDADAQEWRSLSLFETEHLDGREILGGLGFAAAVFVAIPALALLSALMLDGLQSLMGPSVEELPPAPLEVIETRFVRLGKPRDSRRLPSKDIPVEQAAPEPTAPKPTPTAPAPVPSQAKPEKGLAKAKEEPKQEPVEDLLEQLGESAGAISDLSRGPELEGHEEGIAEGTKATGDEREIYQGKLYQYFRRGWNVPTSISDEALNELACVVAIQVTEDGRVGGYEVTRPSGNDVFDESVLLRIAQAEDAELPEPPASVAPMVLGQVISLRFFGRHAR